MDARLFVAVLWRFKKLVLGGFVLGVILALFAYGSPSIVNGKPAIVPRGAESWQSQAELIITEPGFPYGRASEQYTPTSAATGAPAVPVGDPTYMSGLAPIYSALANGNALQSKIHTTAGVPGTVSATQVVNATTSSALPFVQLTAVAATGDDASKLASTAATVLVNYIHQQQVAAGVAAADRVELQVVENGAAPQLVSGHKMSIPLLVFVAVFGAAIALAFILENAQPAVAAMVGISPTRDESVVPRFRASQPVSRVTHIADEIPAQTDRTTRTAPRSTTIERRSVKR